MKKINIPKQLILFVVGVLLGVIIIQQLYLNKKITTVSQPDQNEALGYQISQLVKNNEKLETELSQLKEEKQKTVQSLDDKQTASVNIVQTQTKYAIISGTKVVFGQGVEVDIPDKLELVQIVDLVNALRNIGAEAIAINNKRIGPKTGIDNATFSKPYKIDVIGDPDVLLNALTRPGGINSQIGQKMDVSKKDSVELVALDK